MPCILLLLFLRLYLFDYIRRYSADRHKLFIVVRIYCADQLVHSVSYFELLVNILRYFAYALLVVLYYFLNYSRLFLLLAQRL